MAARKQLIETLFIDEGFGALDSGSLDLAMAEGHIERLEKLFAFIGAPAKDRKCDAIREIIKEAEGTTKKATDGTVRDAAIIAAAQAIAHFEISRYGALQAWAQKLGIAEAANLLDETLHEKKDTDETLNKLAGSEINVNAENKNDEQVDDPNEIRKNETCVSPLLSMRRSTALRVLASFL